MTRIVTVSVDNGNMTVNQQFLSLLKKNQLMTAQALWDYTGKMVKNLLAERSTEQVFLDDDGQKVECYIKRYKKIPLREKFKNICYFKPFAFDAFHEFKAISAFLENDLDTMQPMAVARLSGGRSVNLTLGIKGCTRSSDLFQTLDNRERKYQLISKIGAIAGKMHRLGFAHQDFYLVHLFIRENEDDRVFVIDLQRMLMQKRLSWRWRIKDLAQILFASHKYISFGDKGRFWRHYCAEVGENFYRDKKFIKKITAKASRIIIRDKAKAALK